VYSDSSHECVQVTVEEIFGASSRTTKQRDERAIGNGGRMRATRKGDRLAVRLIVLLLFLLSLISLSWSFQLQSRNERLTQSTHKRWHPTLQSRRGNESLCPNHLRQRMPPPRSTLSAAFLTALPLHSLSPSISALLALTVPTLAGFMGEKFVPNVGILVTLVAAAVLSNLRLAPLSHPLYDLCWTLFLPASLALLLLSSASDSDSSLDDASSSLNDSQVVDTVKTVAVPFAVASIGSILGCIVSFLVCRQYPTLWLSPTSAILAASCLCASYVGGSVNFFATANLLQTKSSDLMTSMAAADLMVMAVYFCFLTAALQSKPLVRLFDNQSHNQTMSDIVPVSDNMDIEVGDHNRKHVPKDRPLSRIQTAVAAISAASLAWIIVQIANRVEDKLAASIRMPGTACAVIALLTTIISRYAPRNSLWINMQCVASPLSQVCFHLLFASIGMSANIGTALQAGPACLLFSMTALFIHVVVTLGGSLVCKRILNRKIELQRVLVASNAAIGGPATAAAFCGQVKNLVQGLTLAATVWGVVGYAIGTGIGVSLSRVLTAMM